MTDDNLPDIIANVKRSEPFIRLPRWVRRLLKIRAIDSTEYVILTTVIDLEYQKQHAPTKTVLSREIEGEVPFSRKHVQETLRSLVEKRLVLRVKRGHYATNLVCDCNPQVTNQEEEQPATCYPQVTNQEEEQPATCYPQVTTKLPTGNNEVTHRLQLKSNEQLPEQVKGASKNKNKSGARVRSRSEPTGSQRTPRAVKPKPPPDPNVKICIDMFARLHQELRDSEYFVSWAKDGALFKTLLKTFPPETLEVRMRAFFTDQEDWLNNKPRDVGMFAKRINRYLPAGNTSVRHTERPFQAIPPVTLEG
jgi:hypothetical protein